MSWDGSHLNFPQLVLLNPMKHNFSMLKDSWGEINIAIGQCKDTQKWVLPVLHDPLPELWFLIQKTPALTEITGPELSTSPTTQSKLRHGKGSQCICSCALYNTDMFSSDYREIPDLLGYAGCHLLGYLTVS